MPVKEKPEKPRADYPLFAHNNGQWAKKIGGSLRYFGPWEKSEAAETKYRAAHLAGPSPMPVESSSTQSPAPKLPRGFPLTLRNDGRYCKQVSGRTYYFGKDRDEALRLFQEQREEIFAGRLAPPKTGTLTTKQLVDAFLEHFEGQVRSGERARRTLNDYKGASKQILGHFGESRLVERIKPMDFAKYRAAFAAARTRPKTILNFIIRNKVIFNFAHEFGLVSNPFLWGKFFAPPSDRTLELSREQSPRKLFESSEIHQLLRSANVDQKAMILLGINCAFGPMDISTLTFKVIDRDKKLVTHIRSKTGKPRECALWPETIEAIEAWEVVRPKSEFSEQVFVTPLGKRWYLPGDESTSELVRYLHDLWAPFDAGKTFYALRHTFRTIAGERIFDKDAIKWVMGHGSSRSDRMSDSYNQRQLPERIKAVTDAVHDWLYTKPAAENPS